MFEYNFKGLPEPEYRRVCSDCLRSGRPRSWSLSPGRGEFLFSPRRPAQPHIKWVQGTITPAVKWLGLESDHSPPISAEVKKNMDLYIHCPQSFSWRSA
jgi:hypothetical protein